MQACASSRGKATYRLVSTKLSNFVGHRYPSTLLFRVVTGLFGALYVWVHRKYVMFMRQNMCMKELPATKVSLRSLRPIG